MRREWTGGQTGQSPLSALPGWHVSGQHRRNPTSTNRFARRKTQTMRKHLSHLEETKKNRHQLQLCFGLILTESTYLHGKHEKLDFIHHPSTKSVQRV